MLRFAFGLIALDLYLRLVPSALQATGALWVAVFLGFFVLAHIVAKWSGAGGLGELGLRREPGWGRHLAFGLAVGMGVWALMYGAHVGLGNLRFLGWNPPHHFAVHAVQAIVVAVLGSASNDVLVRGYVFAQLRGRLPVATVVAVSTVLYALDDIWLAGWSTTNLVFSLAIGLAFAISVVRTGTLWMNIGLHSGLNLIYWLLEGFDKGIGGVARLEWVRPSQWWSSPRYLVLVAAVLVLGAVLARRTPAPAKVPAG